jgi:MGT family glycosyltransferase
MARIVYFSFPAHGHINPTLPVIRELVSRGEEISYFGTHRFASAIRQTGARFCPYTERVHMPEHGPGPFAQVSTTLETLLNFCGAVLDDHLDAVRKLRPTHVMFDSFAPWGRMVAQLLGLPTIASVPSILINRAIDLRYGTGPGQPPEDPRLTAEWCAWFRARCHSRMLGYHLPEPMTPPQLLQTYGDLNLVYTSRLFQPLAESFDERRFQFVGPCCEFRPDAPSFPFEQLDDRPLVLVSLGTVYGRHPEFLRKCMAELAPGPWQVVLATGGDSPIWDTTSGDAAPSNFIVRASVPQVEILRRAAAFITHAGMNSVQEALYCGVPLVMAPQAADQFWIAARVAELGAGLVLDAPLLTPGAIGASVAQVVSGAGYADTAARMAQSLHTAGGHRRAADEIHAFMEHCLQKKAG